MRFYCYWRRQFVNIKNDLLYKLKPNHLMKYNSEKQKKLLLEVIRFASG